MISFQKIKILSVIILSALFLNSCKGLPKSGDGRLVNPQDRVKKNLEEGRGFRIMDSIGKNGGSTNYEFASSNPLWRASLDTLDFMPLASVNYSGGIIVTDWYSDDNSNESIKISIRFLTNEVRSDALDINIFNKNCSTQIKCTITKKTGALNKELNVKILKTAAIYEKSQKDKKFRPYSNKVSEIPKP